MSASTGTADDRGGNDKADALVDLKRKMERSAQLLVGPVRTSGPLIYDISRDGMQPGELENRQLWLNGDSMTKRRGSVG
jgi:hypothetical protein